MTDTTNLLQALEEISKACPAYNEFTIDATLSDFGGNADDYARHLSALEAARIGDIARQALSSPSVHRQASAGQEGVTDVWDYEVMSVDGQWCHESRTGEAPDCEMFVIRNLRKRTPLDTPRLQQLFGDAIEGALAFGFQGNNPPPEGHWLWRFWNIGRAEATKAAALSTAAPESGWSPIETAPKDGTRVILEWDGKSINGFYLDNSQSSHPWQGWRVESLVVKPSGNPTRWQPFPAAGETQ